MACGISGACNYPTDRREPRAAHGAIPRQAVEAIVRESRLAQGLPERISNPVIIARLAVLISAATGSERSDREVRL